MLLNVKPEDVLFIDIETVPSARSYDDLDPSIRYHWEKKSKQFRTEEQLPGEVYERAGIFAEFGRIICISTGFISERNPFSFRIKSFYGDDEKEILTGFSELIRKFSRNREMLLCAHNGKEFDYPYIARRMIINRIVVPEILDNAGKKPWEIKLLDTLDLWKFGDYKSYTSLDLLTSILGISSPKDDIDGSQVAGIYWDEHDLDRIAGYCEKDVVAVARVLLRFMNLPSIEQERIESVTFS
ncbi:MAG: 3'-5' exonuclease [Bacteroidales bacterium]|nr:3'-5' exonuclease [Bacteroidales bacterium]